MDDKNDSKRDFIRMAGVGGLVCASGLPGYASTGAGGQGDFSFVQLTDTL